MTVTKLGFENRIYQYRQLNDNNIEISTNMTSQLFPEGGWDVHHHVFERKTSINGVSLTRNTPVHELQEMLT